METISFGNNIKIVKDKIVSYCVEKQTLKVHTCSNIHFSVPYDTEEEAMSNYHALDEIMQSNVAPQVEAAKPNPYSGTSFDYNGHTCGMCARDNGIEISIDGKMRTYVPLEQEPALESLVHNSVWSEKDEEMLNEVIKDIEKLAGPYVCYYKDVDFLKSLKDRVQPQSHQWSEEDSKMVEDIVKYLKKCQLQMPDYRVELLLRWLRSLKERVQPKQELSEEDIVAIDSAVEALSKDLPSLAASIQRLKSLSPQNSWKPSKNHLIMLRRVIVFLTPGEVRESLESLYNDLNKLMEEKV